MISISKALKMKNFFPLPYAHVLKYSRGKLWGNAVPVRFLATSQSKLAGRKPREQEFPGFKKIFLASIIGTGIFVLAVKQMDHRKPKTEYTEAEYANVMNGLKRRVALFQPGEININVYLAGARVPKSGKTDSCLNIVPSSVVQFYKDEPEGAYEPFLNELYASRSQETLDESSLAALPSGMLVSLIGKYMKLKAKRGDTVNILNFPASMKDAFQLENEIGIIDHIYVPKNQEESDICKYFQTVDKAVIV